MISPLTGTESTKEKSKQNITRDIEIRKRTLDAVHTGQSPRQRADGGERRVDMGRQKVLSIGMQPPKYVNQ